MPEAGGFDDEPELEITSDMPIVALAGTYTRRGGIHRIGFYKAKKTQDEHQRTTLLTWFRNLFEQHHQTPAISRFVANGDDCPVCLRQMVRGGDPIYVLSCEHALHCTCYDELRHMCPLCRGDVVPDRMVV